MIVPTHGSKKKSGVPLHRTYEVAHQPHVLEILKQLRGGGESVVYELKQFYTF
jgi:hypothetical protein